MTNTTGALANQPKNLNLQGMHNFRFQIKKTPNMNYFLQRVSIPSVSINMIEMPTPNVNIPIPGTQLAYDQLNIDFILDEDFKNYLEIFNWLHNLSENYQSLSQESTSLRVGQYKPFVNFTTSDCNLIINTNKSNPNLNIVFEDAWPSFISQVDFDSTIESVDPITVSASFYYKKFRIETI